MQVRAVQVLLLILSLILTVVILIASSKYAAWSHAMVSDAAGTWLPLVFYVGTIPFFSLLYIVGHLAALQFNGLPSPPYPHTRGSLPSKSNAQPYNADYTATTTFFMLCVSILHTLAWLGQSILCTSCELGPIIQGHQGLVPKWCPQSQFHDSGQPALASMLSTLAPVKDVLQWVMVAVAAALVECARREYMRADHVSRQQVQLLGAGVDFGGPSRGVNVDFQTKNLTGLELAQISGPKLVFRAEEEARRRREEDAAKQKQQAAKKKQVQFAVGAGAEAGLPQPTGPGAPGNSDNYYGNGLKRSGTLNYMYESRVAVADPTTSQPASGATTTRPSRQEPTAPSPPGNKDNYYGNGDALGLKRSGTLDYESRVAGADVAAATAGQPRRTPATRPQESTAPPPPGKQDNYYGNGSDSAPGLKRSGTLNYMYESRV